ncbi:MAG: NUDIX pyrophosphatase [Bacteroidetes bacterium]|nr:NUDIX pyrophosphatase [Bacteroidota bacterium]
MIQLHIARRLGGRTEYLVLHRSADEPVYPNCWQVVTGGIDPGETAVDAALREMLEETGLRPETMWAVPYVASFYSVKRDQVLNVPVFLALVDPDYDVILSEEHQAFEWLPLDAAIERLIFPTHKEGTTYVHTYILNAEGDVPFPQVFTRSNNAADRSQINDA